MKRILLALLTIVSVSFSQEPGRPYTWHERFTIDFDSTETKEIYLHFHSGNRWTIDSTAINPPDWVQTTGDFEVNFRLDSLITSTEYDSMTGYVLELNHEGYPKGDTLWIDWENFTVNADSSAEYISWVPWGRAATALGITKPFSVNLTNKYAPSHGLKFVFTQVANDSAGSNDMHSRMTFDINGVR